MMRPSVRATVSAVRLLLFPALLAAQNTPSLPLVKSAQADVQAGETAQPNWPTAPVRGAHAMATSDEALASEAGVKILKEGGNAVDAAVALAFALAVVEPEAGNIGGGGFMLVRMADGRTGFVDYREEAPKRATRNMYLGPDGNLIPGASTAGYLSVGVPGTIAGMSVALRTYGTMKLSQVMAPSIRLARDGFPVSEKLAASLREAQPRLEKFPNSRRIFLKDGKLFRPGEIFRQPQLAKTLERIARHGPEEFYGGRTGRDIAKQMGANGGLITLDDLRSYRAKIRKPLEASYEFRARQWEIITSPPPSSGGIAILEALNILEPYKLVSWADAQSVHWVVEALRRAFADRAAFLGDSDFVHVPVRGLIDPRYAAERRATIDPRLANSSKEIGAGNPTPLDHPLGTPPASRASEPEFENAFADPAGRAAATKWMLAEDRRSGHTTHFSVMDAAGDAVANTYTLNDSYGSGVTTVDGFLLNDEMDDFTSRLGTPNMFGLLQSEANAIGPGKRPLSSMVPTILLRDGRVSFVTGSPGGPRIISATLLSILNWMRLGMGAQQAINAPRFHQQWMPDVVYVEPAFPAAVATELEQRGYHVTERSWIGDVEAIGIDPKTGERLGAPDPRRQGAALGY